MRVALFIVIGAYAILGVAYAVKTPIWQAPDEPAHFNYVRNIAEGRGLPILQQGDYNYEYLEKLKAARFPKDMPVDSIRYESHQPPLYYLLASPLYIAGRGLPLESQVLVLRLFSVLLGGLLLAAAYGAVRQVFPGNNVIALAVPAFIALLPQHIAMTASVNNDALAGLVVTAILILLTHEVCSTERGELSRDIRATLGLGVLLGLALLTKTTAYTAIVFVPAGLLLAQRLRPRDRRGGLGKRLLVIGAVALIVAGWWFVRNAAVYGLTDPLGLARHDLIVAGQPLTEKLDFPTLKSFASVTFKSFWAQFGWMGLPADDRTYAILAALTAVAKLGFILFVIRVVREKEALSTQQRTWLSMLGVALLLVVVGMWVYNLRFVQPQGRYLFSAILPIAVFFTLGLREMASPRYEALVFVLVYAGMFLLNLVFLYRLIPQLG